MKKPDNSKTERQWGLLGRIPVADAEPDYVWTDDSGNPCTFYYLEQDTREMTETEKIAFEEADRKKHPSQYGAETRDHKRMRLAYEKNQAAYEAWSEHWALFNQRCRDRYYYRRSATKERRKALAQMVMRDFPKATFYDVLDQVGGSRETVWEFGLWEERDHPYEKENRDLFYVYRHLRAAPQDIQLAIDDPARFAMWAARLVKPAAVRKYVPRILRDIGAGSV